MLRELHIKNFALIEQADIEFGSGLTVLSGETGAGKSILIDAIGAVLGNKISKDMIRTGTKESYIELIFDIQDDSKIAKLYEEGFELDDNILIISRKISIDRSIIRINGEAASSSVVKRLTDNLISIQGQQEQYTLTSNLRQLAYLDAYIGKECQSIKKEIESTYDEYKKVSDILDESIDEKLRNKEAELLSYEIDEIDKADLKKGEEEELHAIYAKYRNSSKIAASLSKANEILNNIDLSYAIKNINDISSYDEAIADIEKQLSDIDNLLDETIKDMSSYFDNMEYDEEEFERIEKRLDIIHDIQAKYSDDISDILKLREKKEERLKYLDNYDIKRQEMIESKNILQDKLDKLCDKLTSIRKKAASKMSCDITDRLSQLNMGESRFEIKFDIKKEYSANGRDNIEFLLSTNVGEMPKSISRIASGGELSRLMLAIRAVSADIDNTKVLIFDEIDAGISGRTAQKVAESLYDVSKGKQVLCISHLPQIAAMADNHILISKDNDGNSTRTTIKNLDSEGMIDEIARLTSGAKITKAVRDAATEMKELANKYKK